MTILLISDLDMLCWLFFLYFSSTAARANWLMPALLITGLFAYLVAVDLEHYIPFYRIYRYILINDLMPDDVEALFRVNGLYTFALAFPQPDGQILGVSGELQDVSHEQALASEVNLADLGRREAFTLMEVQDVNNKQSVNDELKLADQGRREALKLQWFAHCELLRKQRSHECCRS